MGRCKPIYLAPLGEGETGDQEGLDSHHLSGDGCHLSGQVARMSY